MQLCLQMSMHLQIDGLGTASIPRVKLRGRKYLHVTNKRKWVNRLCHSKQCNNIWFIFLIKVQFLKSQVKRSSHVELLHKYFGTRSWNFLQRFSGMRSVLQISLVSSCLWCSGCPDKGSGLHSPAQTFPIHIQIFTQMGKNPSIKSAKTSEDDPTVNVHHSEYTVCGHFSCPFANAAEVSSLGEKITSIMCSQLQKRGNYLLFRR